ncbi:MAG: sulfatase [Gemmatimonadota bacterium]
MTSIAATDGQRAAGRLRDVLWVVAWSALAGAIAEFALIFGARIALERYSMLNPQGIWLAPIANAFVMGPVILLVWYVVRIFAPRRAFASAIAVGSFLAVLEPLLVLKGRLHIAAMLLLAAGVGVQLALLVQSRPLVMQRWLRRLTSVLASVAVIGGLGFNGVRAWRQRQAVAALPDAAVGAPNVLLLVLDTVRALSLSAYGYARPTTPTLAALAARGVRFDRAVSTAPWTLPTHATLFTGRYPHEMSAGWSVPLDGTFPTLAERLSSLGYATGGFAANLRYCSYEFGVTRGFGYYRDYDVSISEMWRSSLLTSTLGLWMVQRLGGYSAPGRLWADRMNERLVTWLDNETLRDPKRPFFAFVNYYDAHGPYEPPAPFDTLFSGKEPPTRDSGSRDFTREEVLGLIDAYDASIAYLDRELGILFDALQQRGLLENTIIIVTSDHGEEFNEHGQMNHGNTLYFPSLHVPLIIAGRDIPRAVGITEPVTLRDVPATILDIVGAGPNVTLPGSSLARLWQTQVDSLKPAAPSSVVYGEVDYARNLPSSIPVSQGSMKSVVVDGHHLIRAANGGEEMYDILSDPWERTNVLQLPEKRAIVERGRALLDQAWERDVRRPAAEPNGKPD